MSVRVVYITKEEFETYQANDRFYEGFVIGVGYAYIEEKMMQPNALNGYKRSLSVKYEPGEFGFVKFQCLDTSLQMIELSSQAAVSGTYRPYHVYKGESLWSIAKSLGVTVDDITRWNGINASDTIHPGQVLMVDVDKAKSWEDLKIGSYYEEEGSQDRGGSATMVTNISFSAASIYIAAKLRLENYAYLSQLANSNKFMGMRNGALTVMDNSFLSTQRMAVTRGAEKAAFLSKVNKLGWLKKFGTGLGIVTTLNSTYEFAVAETTEGKLEHGADAIAGIVGFMGPWGALISGNYFLGKEMYPSIIDHEIERADRISRGDYSMAFYRLGRANR